MNGPQHVAEAERLIAAAKVEEQHALGGDPVVVANILAAAAVHAQLAEVAATVASCVTTIGDGETVMTVPGWEQVVS